MTDSNDVPAGMCDGRCLSAYDIGLSGHGVAVVDPWCTQHGSDDAIEARLVKDVEQYTESVTRGLGTPLDGGLPWADRLAAAKATLAEFRAERAAASASDTPTVVHS